MAWFIKGYSLPNVDNDTFLILTFQESQPTVTPCDHLSRNWRHIIGMSNPLNNGKIDRFNICHVSTSQPHNYMYMKICNPVFFMRLSLWILFRDKPDLTNPNILFLFNPIWYILTSEVLEPYIRNAKLVIAGPTYGLVPISGARSSAGTTSTIELDLFHSEFLQSTMSF